MAFWNRWTLGLDFGPGNAGLWTEISAQNTQNLLFISLLGRDFSEISIQSPAFPGPKSRPSDFKMPKNCFLRILQYREGSQDLGHFLVLTNCNMDTELCTLAAKSVSLLSFELEYLQRNQSLR